MRARNIKPGFFKNEDLIELSFETRLLFVGLWCLADREGRLEDRPKRIKLELFPGDSVDIEKMLSELSDAGFVLRFTHNSSRYIQVLNFKKHQNPHCKERGSTIPAPCENGASTVQAPCNNEASTVVAHLIPDSLIPDSPIPTDEGPADPYARAREDTPSRCPYEKLVDSYHRFLPTLPRVNKLGDALKRNLRGRWKEHPDVLWFDWYFDGCSRSDYLLGRYSSVQIEDPGIAHVVELWGGWPEVCDISEKEWPYRQKEFLELYRAGRVSKDTRTHFSGLVESKNRELGFMDEIPKPHILTEEGRHILQLEHLENPPPKQIPESTDRETTP